MQFFSEASRACRGARGLLTCPYTRRPGGEDESQVAREDELHESVGDEQNSHDGEEFAFGGGSREGWDGPGAAGRVLQQGRWSEASSLVWEVGSGIGRMQVIGRVGWGADEHGFAQQPYRS